MSIIHVLKYSPVEYTCEYAFNLPKEILLKWAVECYNQDCILLDPSDKKEEVFTELVDSILHRSKGDIRWFIESAGLSPHREKSKEILMKMLVDIED